MPPQQPQQPAAAGGGNSRVKFESALDFLEKVKTVFADQPGVYNQFLDIMKGFKTQTYVDFLDFRAMGFACHDVVRHGSNHFLPLHFSKPKFCSCQGP
jgi:histone deacetylase complex regulatory component SIN3